MKDIMTDKAAGKPCGGVQSDKFNTANENRQEAYIDRRRWELKIDDIILQVYTHTYNLCGHDYQSGYLYKFHTEIKIKSKTMTFSLLEVLNLNFTFKQLKLKCIKKYIALITLVE